jgi:hypothetical protein
MDGRGDEIIFVALSEVVRALRTTQSKRLHLNLTPNQ